MSTIPYVPTYLRQPGGSGGGGGGGGGFATATIVTGDQSPSVGDFLGIDTTLAGSIVTLPAGAENRGMIALEDPYDTWSINPVTVDPPEGFTVAGVASLTLDEAARVILIVDADAADWRIKELMEMYP